MRILYGYSNCTDKTYNRIVSERHVSTMVPDQKYHGLLIKGLSSNGARVRCFSGLPVNRAVTKRKWVSEPDEQEENAYFHYISTFNFPVIRQLMIFFGTFFGLLKEKKDSDTYAVCDFLNTATAAAFVLACKLRRIGIISVVTDLPDMFDTGKLRNAVSNFLLRHFDGYLFLTKYMRRFVKKDKPFLVLEGHVDSALASFAAERSYESAEGKKLVLYAGSIQRRYGIEYLTKGFIKADITDAELRVYGKGDFKEELESLAGQHPNVRYMGVCPNSEIVEEEMKASLLINPRPTFEEYTKYSFPSKNMEYMVSGTPLLTTKLPGMPEEYYPYVYLIEDETEEGMAQVLRKVLSIPYREREEKGAAAREYVLKNKSNTVQAKKIIDFLHTI